MIRLACSTLSMLGKIFFLRGMLYSILLGVLFMVLLAELERMGSLSSAFMSIRVGRRPRARTRTKRNGGVRVRVETGARSRAKRCWHLMGFR